jgi:hypothetical protein
MSALAAAACSGTGAGGAPEDPALPSDHPGMPRLGDQGRARVCGLLRPESESAALTIGEQTGPVLAVAVDELRVAASAEHEQLRPKGGRGRYGAFVEACLHKHST